MTEWFLIPLQWVAGAGLGIGLAEWRHRRRTKKRPTWEAPASKADRHVYKEPEKRTWGKNDRTGN